MDAVSLSAAVFIIVAFILPMKSVKNNSFFYWVFYIAFIANFFQFGYYSGIDEFTWFGIGFTVGSIIVALMAGTTALIDARREE